MLRNRSGSPTFPRPTKPSRTKLASPGLSQSLFHTRGSSPPSALDSLPKLIQPASTTDTGRSKAKSVGDISLHLAEYIQDLVHCQVNFEVGDLRARLDRLEALLFHADLETFEAIDKFISEAKKWHASDQRAAKKSLDRSAESSSPEPTAGKPFAPTRRTAKVLSRKVAGDVIETAALQPVQGESTRVERVAALSPDRLAEKSSELFSVGPDMLVHEEASKFVSNTAPAVAEKVTTSSQGIGAGKLFAPPRPARVLGRQLHAVGEVNETADFHTAQEEATHVEPVSTLKPAPQLKSASTIVCGSLPEHIHGLWATSCGRVVRVDNLGCRFDSGPRDFESESYKLSYCKSNSSTIRDQIIWTQRETGDSSTWHRLSHSTLGEWTPMSDNARVGDVVRVDHRFNYFVEGESEPMTFLEGLRGCIVDIDDGDWLIDFPSLGDGLSQRWVMKADATQLSVFTSVATTAALK